MTSLLVMLAAISAFGGDGMNRDDMLIPLERIQGSVFQMRGGK